MTAVDIIRAHRSGLINNETMAAALAGDVRALAYTQWKLDGNDGPASPPDGWQAPVTVETLTDEQIEAYGDAMMAERNIGQWNLARSGVSRSPLASRSELFSAIRVKLAAAINARREGSK